MKKLADDIFNGFMFAVFLGLVALVLLLVGLPAAWYFGSTTDSTDSTGPSPDCPCECPSEIIE